MLQQRGVYIAEISFLFIFDQVEVNAVHEHKLKLTTTPQTSSENAKRILFQLVQSKFKFIHKIVPKKNTLP